MVIAPPIRIACLLAILLSWLAGPVVHAQAPPWTTVLPVTTGAPNYAMVRGACTDANGDLYAIGEFRGTASFGSTTLSSSNSYQLFVAKWETASGQFRWAIQAGAGSSHVSGFAVAATGTSVYVACSFSGPTAQFGSTTFTQNSTHSGSTHLVIAKLIDAGSSASFAWAVGAEGDNDIFPNAIAVHGTSVYVTGMFSSPVATFGNLTLTNANTGAFPTVDSFVAKLNDTDSSPVYEWVQQASGPNNEYISSVACHGTSVYIAGYFGSTTAMLGPYTLVQTASNDLFVAKIADSGSSSSFVWVNRATCTGNTAVTAMAANGNDLYLGGSMCGATTQFGPNLLSNAGANFSSDAFVVNLRDDGPTSHYVWAQRAGGTGNDGVMAVAVRDSSVFVTGSFESNSVSFGNTTLTNTPPSPINQGANVSEIFVAKLQSTPTAGNFQWAQSAGGPGNEYSYAIAATPTQVWIGGRANAQAQFGSLSLGSNNGGGFIAAIGTAVLSTAGAKSQDWSPVVYPNPATGSTSVWLPAITGTAALTLTNSLGQEVKAITVKAPLGAAVPIDVAGFSSGVYSLRITAGNHTVVRRFVVQ